MPYVCKRCGSSVVYHSCAAVMRGGAARVLHTTPSSHPFAATAISSSCANTTTDGPLRRMGLSSDVQSQPSAPLPTPAITTIAAEAQGPPERLVARTAVAYASEATVAPAPADKRCVQCGVGGAVRARGLTWCQEQRHVVRVKGERLCDACRRRLCDELVDYMPLPHAKPGCYLIVRTQSMARIRRRDAVTLLVLRGRFTAASAMARSAAKTVSRARVE